jgi:hypothetical protein
MPAIYSSWARGTTHAPANNTLVLGTPVYTADFSTITSNSTATLRSAMVVVGMIVKNSGAAVLYPKHLCIWKTGCTGTEVNGRICTTAGQAAGFVDEHVVSTGVPVSDNFLLIVNGPCLGVTDLAGGANNLIPAESELYGLTAATSNATTSGRVYPLDGTFTATQTTDGTAAKVALNRVGRAISAKTTGQTNGDIYLYAMLQVRP